MGLEAVLFALLTWRRVYRELPIFYSCIAFEFGLDLAAWFLTRQLSPTVYLRQFIFQLTSDAVFQLAVCAELGRKLLRYNRCAPPRRIAVIAVIGIACALIWCLAHWSVPAQSSIIMVLYVRLRQGFGILQVGVLLAIVGLSQILKLRWPERGLQIATGLGINFIVALAVTVLETHQFPDSVSHRLDQLVIFSVVVSLAYWVLCFAQKTEKRQNISHKFENSCY